MQVERCKMILEITILKHSCLLICLLVHSFSMCMAADDFLQINWTLASATADTETSLLPVSYVPLAPCQCDVTAHCDPNCCCDPHCAQWQRAIFGTLCDGNVNGMQCPKPDLLRVHMSAGALSCLCVQWSHSPHLGTFFPMLEAGGTVDRFYDLVQYWSRKKDSYNWPLTAASNLATFTIPNELQPGYKSGAPIQLSDPKVRGRISPLTLPHTLIMEGVACGWQNPVSFLENRMAYCPVFVDQNVCVRDRRLQAASYVTQRDDAKVLSRPLDGTTLEATVSYYCMPNETSISTTKSFNPNEEYWFSARGLLVNSQTSIPCKSAGLVPITKLDASGLFCENVVSSVEYGLLWNGSNITAFDVKVTLRKIHLNTTTPLKFRVLFSHITSPVRELLAHSAPPLIPLAGYLIGQSVIGFTEDKLTALREGKLTWEVADSHRAVAVWRTDSTGLCVSANLYPIKFGYNVTSSCKLRISFDSFQDCGKLRQKLMDNYLRILFPAAVLSRIGPNQRIFDEDGDFYLQDVFRENITDTLNWAAILDALSLPPNAAANNETIAANKQPLNSYCSFLPYVASLDIMYARVASETRANGLVHVYEILAAYQYFNFTRWSFSKLDTSSPQTFLVTGAVNFYEVPAKRETPLARMQLFYLTSLCTCDSQILHSSPALPLSFIRNVLAGNWPCRAEKKLFVAGRPCLPFGYDFSVRRGYCGSLLYYQTVDNLMRVDK